MNRQNPYASSGTSSSMSEQGQTRRPKKIWIGYLFAPAVAPTVAAAAIFFGGESLVDPNDTGTPIGIILLPILLMTVGMVISYLLTLVIGLPIAFFLERRAILNGYTIHMAAIAVSVLFAVAFAMISFCMWLLGSNPRPPSLIELPKAIGFMFCAFGIFIMPTATAFWLIACKLVGKSPQIEQIEP